MKTVTDRRTGKPTDSHLEAEGAELRLMCENTPIYLRFEDNHWSVVDESTLRAEMSVLSGLGADTNGLDRALGVCAALNAYLIYPDEATSLNRQLAALEKRRPSRFYRVDHESRIALTTACAFMHTEGAWRWLLWMLPKRLEPSCGSCWGVVPGAFGWKELDYHWEQNSNFVYWLNDEFFEAMAHHRDERFAQLIVATDPDAAPKALRKLASSQHWEIRDLVAYNRNTPHDVLLSLFEPTTGSLSDITLQKLRMRLMQRISPPAKLFKLVSEEYLTKRLMSPVPSPTCYAQALAHRARMEISVILQYVVHNAEVPTKILNKIACGLSPEYPNAEDILGTIAAHRRTSRTSLRRLSKDQNPKVREAVARNPKASPEVIDRLSRDGKHSVRAAVAQRLDAGADRLEWLASDKAVRVRRFVALHTSTPSHVLESLTFDPDRWVVLHAIANPNLSAESAYFAQKRLLAQSAGENNTSAAEFAAGAPVTTSLSEGKNDTRAAEFAAARGAGADGVNADGTGICRMGAAGPEERANVMSFCCRLDTCAAVLRQLAEKLSYQRDSYEVEAWGRLASHPNSPADLLEDILRRALALAAPNEPDADAEKSGTRYLLGELLANPNMPGELRIRVADALRSFEPRTSRRHSVEARKLAEARQRSRKSKARKSTTESAHDGGQVGAQATARSNHSRT